MKKYSKLIIAVIIALIFIGTFVFLWQKSQPKEVVYKTDYRRYYRADFHRNLRVPLAEKPTQRSGLQ